MSARWWVETYSTAYGYCEECKVQVTCSPWPGIGAGCPGKHFMIPATRPLTRWQQIIEYLKVLYR